MKPDQNAELIQGAKRSESLTKVLGQSEHVKELVEESAEELSSVNKIIKQELTNGGPVRGIENVLEKSEGIERKVEEAAEKLTHVNLALEGEVRDRDMLELQFAAAIEQEQAARHAAFHDVLTDLPNRALFNDRLEHGIAQAKRHGWNLAVMFIDLDKFKTINDTYGHDAGDVVLRTIAQRLKENTRNDDTVSRHGGDEFLYLLTEVRDKNNIAMIAEKLINAIQAPCNISLRDLHINPSIGASIGISVLPKDGITADSLIKSADEAMYRAKQTKSGYAFDRRSRVRYVFDSAQTLK